MKTTIPPAIVPLDELRPDAEAQSGAKAFNCARLKQAGFPVPDGLVVLSSATEADLAGLADHSWFDQVPAEVLFAVRSSGIGEDGEGQSFAGIHETILDVRQRDLPAAITRCLASAHSAQALDYRRAKGMDTDAIRMGILIQRMVHPVSAG